MEHDSRTQTKALPLPATAAVLAAASACLLLAALTLGGCDMGQAPDGPRIDHAAALEHYKQSQNLQGSAALKELYASVREDPNLDLAHVAIGDIHRRQGNNELAAKAYERACKINPYYFKPHYDLGVVYQSMAASAKTPQQLKDYLQLACRIYLRAVTLYANDYDANLNLSACYFELGKYSQAEQYCKAAIALDDSRFEAYSNLGIICDSQGRLNESIRAYLDALERNVHQHRIHMNLGSTYMRQERYKLAIASFAAAAKEDPTAAEPYEQTGSCHFIMNDLDQAQKAYEKAIALNPRSAEGPRGLGLVLMVRFLDTGKKNADLRDQALECWYRSLEYKPNQPKLKELIDRYKPRYEPPKL